MAHRSITRDVGPLSFRADVVPSSFDPEKRTVDLTWTTGARVLRQPWFDEPYMEELSLDPKHVRMGRLQSGNAPLLNNHSSRSLDDVIGVVESAQLDPGGKTASARVRFARSPLAEDVMQKVGDKIIRNVSVGYRVHKMTKVEGGDSQMTVMRAVDWEPHEISPVPIGADAGAVMRADSQTITNPCEFTFEERTMPDPVVTPAQPDQIRDAERARVLGIQRAGRALNRPSAEVEAAIAGNTSLDDYHRSAIDAVATGPADSGGVIPFARRDPAIEAGEDRRDKWHRGASAWIIERAGLGQLFAEAHSVASTPRYRNQRWAQEVVKLDLDPGEFRGMRMLDLARESLELGSVKTRGMMAQELVGRAFTMVMRSPTQSTSDFSLILENVLYKTLLAQYMVEPDTWTRFCRTGSVADFRASKRYRLGTFGTLNSLNELGEFINKAIPDAERQSITAGTKGNIIAISRQAIINDDMGAFSELATWFGRAAKLTIEVDVYNLLKANAGLGATMDDGKPLFDAAHGNISAGVALGSTAIDLDRVQMARQQDPSKNEIISLNPAIIVVPTELGGTVRQINNGEYDFDALTTKNPWTPNKVRGLFTDIIDTPRLTGTRRYLFAPPGTAPTIEVAFVEGQQQPFMDFQQGWRVDGAEWKVRIDYGTASVDFRGAVTNAG